MRDPSSSMHAARSREMLWGLGARLFAAWGEQTAASRAAESCADKHHKRGLLLPLARALALPFCPSSLPPSHPPPSRPPPAAACLPAVTCPALLVCRSSPVSSSPSPSSSSSSCSCSSSSPSSSSSSSPHEHERTADGGGTRGAGGQERVLRRTATKKPPERRGGRVGRGGRSATAQAGEADSGGATQGVVERGFIRGGALGEQARTRPSRARTRPLRAMTRTLRARTRPLRA